MTRFGVSKGKFAKIKIPTPPLPVQEEIVRILDKFVELEAELEARKIQYEFYRGELFYSKSKDKIKILSEVSDIYDSLHATPKYSAEGYPMIRVADVKGGYVDYSKVLRVNAENFKKFTKKYKPKFGDIVISRVGSYGNTCLLDEKEVCLGQNTSIIHPKINGKYLYYYLNSDYVEGYIDNNVKGAGYKSLSLANVKSIPILVPNAEEQERIVSILDKFDKLTNDISKGLPAEIQMRREQYEYYRNKLLTFKELENE